MESRYNQIELVGHHSYRGCDTVVMGWALVEE